MAYTKIYTVVKDGEELEQLKTLTAAKKVADTEGAEVYCEGECVYNAHTAHSDKQPTEAAQPAQPEEGAQPIPEQSTEEAQPAEEKSLSAEQPTQPSGEEAEGDGAFECVRYRLKAMMNVRKKPSLTAPILGTRAAGTVVRVMSIENGWLHLRDGTFILYSGGQFAEKID